MKLLKFSTLLTGMAILASSANAAMMIDTQAYHEQRQAEKKARAEAQRTAPAIMRQTPVAIKSKEIKAEVTAKDQIMPEAAVPENQTSDVVVNAAVNALQEEMVN